MRRRRAQNAIAEIHLFGTKGYQRVLRADVEGCFPPSTTLRLLGRARQRWRIGTC